MKPFPVRRAVRLPSLALLAAATACAPDAPATEDGGAAAPASDDRADLIALWEAGEPAFGVFVPDERPREEGARREGPRQPAVYTAEGGRSLARDTLLDFAFLNLEGSWDPEAVRAIASGLDEAGGGPALLVRVPTIEDAGVEATRARVREALEMGADGVVIPHVRNVEEARTAISFFEEADADVWSPANPDGEVVAMLMLEDPDAVARAAEIADLPGYSVLACGIGSLTGALGGDREAGEAGCRSVLTEASRAGLPSMMTANAGSVGERLETGYLGILTQGPEADSVIRLGRAASGGRQP